MLSRPPNFRCDQSCADLQSCLLQLPADSRALGETAGVFYTCCLSKAGWGGAGGRSHPEAQLFLSSKGALVLQLWELNVGYSLFHSKVLV